MRIRSSYDCGLQLRRAIARPRAHVVATTAHRDAQLVIAGFTFLRLWVKGERVLRAKIVCDLLDSLGQFRVRPWKEGFGAGLACDLLQYITWIIDGAAAGKSQLRAGAAEQLVFLRSKVSDRIDLHLGLAEDPHRLLQFVT